MMCNSLRQLLQTECNNLKTIPYQINGATFQLKKILQIVPPGIECCSSEFYCLLVSRPSFFVVGYKFWPSGDINTELSNDDPELKKIFTSCSTLLSKDVITSVKNRISSWLKLKRVILLVLLYKRKLLDQSIQTRSLHQKYIEIAERN